MFFKFWGRIGILWGILLFSRLFQQNLTGLDFFQQVFIPSITMDTTIKNVCYICGRVYLLKTLAIVELFSHDTKSWQSSNFLKCVYMWNGTFLSISNGHQSAPIHANSVFELFEKMEVCVYIGELTNKGHQLFVWPTILHVWTCCKKL